MNSYTVTLQQLQSISDKAMPNPDGMLERILTDRSQSLREWSSKCNTTRLQTGALGNCDFPSLRSSKVAISSSGT